MKKLVFCILLFSASFAAAQNDSIPTLHGHRLGETYRQFYQASYRLQRMIYTCTLNKRSTGCAQIPLDLDSPPAAFLLDNRRNTTSFLLACDFRSDITTAFDPIEFIGAAKFENGRLSYLNITQCGSWSDASEDLERKFGKPTDESDQEYQNDYGARYTIATVKWVRPAYVVFLAESMNGYHDRAIDLEIITPDGYQKLMNAEKRHKNSFD